MFLRLFYACKVLGFSMGISYWWLECQCALNPSKIVRWAANCEVEARKERVRGNIKMAECLEAWAGQLRLHRPELFTASAAEQR